MSKSGKQIFEEYAIGTPHERFVLIHKNYGVFQNVIKSYEHSVFKDMFSIFADCFVQCRKYNLLPDYGLGVDGLVIIVAPLTVKITEGKWCRSYCL